MGGSRGVGTGGQIPSPTWKITYVNILQTPLKGQLDQAISRMRPKWPSVKYVDALKNVVRIPLMQFSGSAHVLSWPIYSGIWIPYPLIN